MSAARATETWVTRVSVHPPIGDSVALHLRLLRRHRRHVRDSLERKSRAEPRAPAGSRGTRCTTTLQTDCERRAGYDVVSTERPERGRDSTWLEDHRTRLSATERADSAETWLHSILFKGDIPEVLQTRRAPTESLEELWNRHRAELDRKAAENDEREEPG